MHSGAQVPIVIEIALVKTRNFWIDILCFRSGGDVPALYRAPAFAAEHVVALKRDGVQLPRPLSPRRGTTVLLRSLNSSSFAMSLPMSFVLTTQVGDFGRTSIRLYSDENSTEI